MDLLLGGTPNELRQTSQTIYIASEGMILLIQNLAGCGMIVHTHQLVISGSTESGIHQQQLGRPLLAVIGLNDCHFHQPRGFQKLFFRYIQRPSPKICLWLESSMFVCRIQNPEDLRAKLSPASGIYDLSSLRPNLSNPKPGHTMGGTMRDSFGRGVTSRSRRERGRAARSGSARGRPSISISRASKAQPWTPSRKQGSFRSYANRTKEHEGQLTNRLPGGPSAVRWPLFVPGC